VQAIAELPDVEFDEMIEGDRAGIVAMVTDVAGR
jgi:hypothetical protein